ERANPTLPRLAARSRNMPSRSTIPASRPSSYGPQGRADSLLSMKQGMSLAQWKTPKPRPWLDTGSRPTAQPRGAAPELKHLTLFWFTRGEGRQWRTCAATLGTASLPGLRKQSLHLAIVGFHPRDAGCHVNKQPIAAQHILALCQDNAATHRDQVGLGIEHRGFASHNLILLRHNDCPARLKPLDGRAAARTRVRGLHRCGFCGGFGGGRARSRCLARFVEHDKPL